MRDLLSTNGIFANDKKVTESALNVGEPLRLGDVELRREISAPSGGTSFISKTLMTSSAVSAAPKPATAKTISEEKTSTPKDFFGRPKNQVLFADDSLAFLENFGGVCTELANKAWDVLITGSAGVALDIGMPMLDGLQLLVIISRPLPPASRLP